MHFLFNTSVTNKCDMCNQVDSVHHYLFECSKYTKERNKFKEILGIDTLTPTAIFSENSSKIYLLIDFVKSTNMFNQI